VGKHSDTWRLSGRALKDKLSKLEPTGEGDFSAKRLQGWQVTQVSY
jgi:hypothetical protein